MTEQETELSTQENQWLQILLNLEEGQTPFPFLFS